MTFNPNAQLDPGQITDRRGMGGRGGLAIGGGGASASSCSRLHFSSAATRTTSAALLEPGAVTDPGARRWRPTARPAQDANARDDCRILGYVNSIQAYWTTEFATSGERYEPVDTVLFSGRDPSGCGTASAATGPFYCPRDQLVYLDLDFFNELRTRFGAQGGSLAQGYVRRPRVRPPRPGPARHPAASGGGVGRDRAARSGRSSRPTASPASGRTTRPSTGFLEAVHRRPDRRCASMRPRRSVTTGSRRRPAARSTRSRGPTARRRSASTGSRPATRAAIRRPATRSTPSDVVNMTHLWHVSA